MWYEENDKHKEERAKFPDFVFHGGLTDTCKENQFMVIEVKRKGNCDNEKLYNDIIKLQKLVDSNKLSFKIGLFIAVGMSKKEVNDIIKENFSKKFKLDNNIQINNILELLYDNSNKIYFIATDNIMQAENIGEKEYKNYYFQPK